jgi:creatinine amidohydrolase
MISLAHITMAEFSRQLKKTKTIVFPFGTIEEHGSHLPLGTDSFIILEALRRAAKTERFFLAPIVWYGVCTSTGQHPGSIVITPETLRRLTADLIRDAYSKGLRNILLISGHGGGLHLSAMKESAEELIGTLTGARIVVCTPWDDLWKEFMALVETPKDGHAGELETSLMLAIDRELVKGRAAEDYPAFPKPLIVADKVRYWKSGVWGNPRKATPEKGEQALGIMTQYIMDILKVMRRTERKKR